MYSIQWTKYSQHDYSSLDGSQKVYIDKAINRIKSRGMEAGEPLKGNLRGCNKLKNHKQGLRIIFRQTNQSVEIIQIVAIGKRENKEIYNTAENRLKNN